jgi:hypothetical protein
MKLYNFIWIIILTLGSCASFKKELIQSGNSNEAIQNAILDFSKSKLYKKDSVFVVWFSDTVSRMVLNKVDDRNYKWIKGKIYDGLLGVDISADYNRLLLTAKKSHLPSRFIEKNGKLFYWWDVSHPVSEDALAIFKKYNLLQDDEGGKITIPDFGTNDAKNGAHYYFCKNDLTKYKKIITNKGIGYYDPPKIECNSK